MRTAPDGRGVAPVRSALLALAVTIVLLPSVAQGASDAGFRGVTGPTALSRAFDLEGQELAWVDKTLAGYEVHLTNLTSRADRVLTAIPASTPSGRIEGLQYDGKWVVWADGRFGNLDLFAVDATSGSLRRLTEAAEDDHQASLHAGRVAWVRGDGLWVLDLQDGVAREVDTGPGAAREPALWNDTLLWVRLGAGQRQIQRAPATGGEPSLFWAADGSFDHEPLVQDGLVAWVSRVLQDPARPDLGYAGHILRVRPLDGGPLSNLSFTQAKPESVAIGPGHLAWTEGHAAIRAAELSLTRGRTFEFAAHEVRVSGQYIVASHAEAEGPLATLSYRDWEPEKVEEGGIPTLGAPLAAIALASAAVVRRR